MEIRVNVLDADTATWRQLFRDTAQIDLMGSAYVSELWGVSLLDYQDGGLVVLVDDKLKVDTTEH